MPYMVKRRRDFPAAFRISPKGGLQAMGFIRAYGYTRLKVCVKLRSYNSGTSQFRCGG